MPDSQHDEQIEPFAAILAFVIPGLGHLALGNPRRGMFIFAGVMGLFFGGMFIGGIDAVDRKEDFWWFVGQAGVGPTAFVVDRAHQSWFKAQDPDAPGGVRTPDPDENPKLIRSLGHPNEIGALYATVAGMLNIICVLDCLWHTPRRRPEPHEARRRGDGVTESRP